MAGLLEKDQIGKRELLADYITIIDAAKKPLLAMVKKSRELTNTYARWQVDDYDDPNLTPEVDGKDVENYENAGEQRAELATYCHFSRRTAKVSKLAEKVSNVAGAKSEMGRSIKKKLEEIGRDMESVLCGDQDSQADTGAIGYQTRGLGEWITDNATTWAHSDQPDYHPPTASIKSDTATTSLAESDVQAVLESMWDQTGADKSFDLICGRALKKVFTNFTNASSGSTNTQVAVKTYTTPADAKKVISNVRFYEGDFNDVRLHPSQFLARASAAAVQRARGYVLDMSMLELMWSEMPDPRKIEDRGGGPRVLIDAVFALCVKNPKGLGKFAPTS